MAKLPTKGLGGFLTRANNAIFNPDAIIKAVKKPSASNTARAVTEVAGLVPLAKSAKPASLGIKAGSNPARGIMVKELANYIQPSIGNVAGQVNFKSGNVSVEATKARARGIVNRVKGIKKGLGI